MGHKKRDQSTEDGKSIISAPVISKNFIKKTGEVSDQKELYIRRSIQDYYIKFCESEITREALEEHLAGMNGTFKVVSLEIEFREGVWDTCDEDLSQQSRMGQYVIIYRIIGD